MARFQYRRKTQIEIEKIAVGVLGRHQQLFSSNILDIERLVEAYKIIIIPRQRLIEPVAGYLAADPHFIVVGEWAYNYRPNLRETLAEEFAHILLENSLYDLAEVPVDAACHKLTDKQHRDVEDNAHSLGCALLLPEKRFLSRWYDAQTHFVAGDVSPHLLLHQCCNQVARDFQVLHRTVYHRLKDLRLINHDEWRDLTTPDPNLM